MKGTYGEKLSTFLVSMAADTEDDDSEFLELASRWSIVYVEMTKKRARKDTDE